VLEEGTGDRAALANRLTDRRYREFSAAFGFGDGLLPRTLRDGFADRIATRYLERQFEIRVGESDETMRLALTLERRLPEIAGRAVRDDTKWLTVMGEPPLRRAFEMALGLPRSFGTLDLDRQLADFKERAGQVFGISRFADFAAPEPRETAMRTFLARAQLADGAGGSSVPSSPALQILGQVDRGSIVSALL